MNKEIEDRLIKAEEKSNHLIHVDLFAEDGDHISSFLVKAIPPVGSHLYLRDSGRMALVGRFEVIRVDYRWALFEGSFPDRLNFLIAGNSDDMAAEIIVKRLT